MNTSSKRQVDYDGHAQGRHAVVLGGSLAGLLAARVLSDHFDEVTLIERDAFNETTEVRRGMPQANHVHGLLLRGREVLEELFPGLQDEMIADGVPLVDMANEIAWYTRAGWGIRFPSEMKVLAFTRPVLDLHVRRRLSSNPRVKIIDNTDVLRLIPDAEKNRLAGVLICPRSTESDRRVAKELHADLVVDTTVVVRGVLLRAFSMMVPPTGLFHPRVLFRVLVHVLKPARKQHVARSTTTVPSAVAPGNVH